MTKYTCPVCKSENEGEFPSSNVCNVCGWEQDAVQEDDPDYRGGANRKSLNECRAALERQKKGTAV